MEERLLRIAASFPYPATPNLTASQRQRLLDQKFSVPPRRPARLAYALVILLVALAAILMVSPVRARVLEWIRIGSVRIFYGPPTPTVPLPGASSNRTPAPTPTFLESILDLDGETTLSEAQEQLDFTIQLPAFPPDLGQPDKVYLQEMNGKVVILVWMDPDQPGEVRMSLSEAPSSQSIFEKYDPKFVLDMQVNRQPAVWIDGDYVLVMRNGDFTMSRLVDQGHTLIWTSGEMTYRLETDADLETAIRIAESIR